MEMNEILEVFIGALVAIVVGVAMLPSVFSGVSVVTSNKTLTAGQGSTIGIIKILPLIFGVIILVGAVGFLAFRRRR